MNDAYDALCACRDAELPLFWRNPRTRMVEVMPDIVAAGKQCMATCRTAAISPDAAPSGQSALIATVLRDAIRSVIAHAQKPGGLLWPR